MMAACHVEGQSIKDYPYGLYLSCDTAARTDAGTQSMGYDQS